MSAKLTLKDAVLKVLETFDKPVKYQEVYEKIKKDSLFSFTAENPEATISTTLGNFIRNTDSRVSRIKSDEGVYLYFLAKKYDGFINEQENKNKENEKTKNKTEDKNSFTERSLHPLLSSFLNSKDIYSKTIFHEKSTNKEDNNQTWTHPDMIAVEFLKFTSQASNNLLKTINKTGSFSIHSYELKKEINSDDQLKLWIFSCF